MQGVARCTAVALLAGYGWLAAGGCAFAALPFVPALRQAGSVGNALAMLVFAAALLRAMPRRDAAASRGSAAR